MNHCHALSRGILGLVLLVSAPLARSAHGLEPDPLAQMSPEEKKTLSQYNVPDDQLKRLLQLKSNWQAARIGLAPFTHLYPRNTVNMDGGDAVLYGGSGYDFADDVMLGMIESGLFVPKQLGISNFPPNENWNYVAGSEWIGTAAYRGLRYFVMDSRGRKVVLTETLPLPQAWDGPDPVASKADFSQAGIPSKESLRVRDETMVRFGKYLAFKLAAFLAGDAK